MQVLSSTNKLDNIYYIKDTIDLYVVNQNTLKIYNINTRYEISLKVSPDIIHFIERLDGTRPLRDCLENGTLVTSSFYTFIEFLEEKDIIKIKNNQYNILNPKDTTRFERQLKYFDDYVTEKKGEEVQQTIFDTKVAIFGVGSVGGTIAVELARTGFRNFIFVDLGTLKEADKQRHWYFSENEIGKPKVEVLARYLKKIDKSIRVESIFSTIYPTTDIDKIIKSADIIINTMSTPYILYTSLKLEQECLKYNIPLYIAGGFDAHLASTGEMIFPPITPCISCYMNYYSNLLSNWQPEYAQTEHNFQNVEIENYETGGLVGQSMFSANFAVLEILQFLLDMYKVTYRGEYDFHRATILYNDEIMRRESCQICNKDTN